MLKTSAGEIIGTHVEPLAVDIPGACRLTGLGRSKIYQLISAGDLKALKVGARTIITVDAIRDCLHLLERKQGAA
jgi:excisionase family DNA binding protein